MTGDAVAVRQRLEEISAKEKVATKGPWQLITDSCDCSPVGCSHGENGTSEFAYAIHTPEHELWQLSNGEPDVCDPADAHDHFHHDRTEVSQFTIADCEFITDARASMPRLVAALTAVLDQHQLILYDKWARQTTDKSQAVVARCATCQRSVPIERGCDTYRAVAAALGEQP